MKNRVVSGGIFSLVGIAATLIGGSGSMAAAPTVDKSEWRLYGNNADAQFFSPLKQINDGNVGKLGLAWYADIPSKSGLAANPLVADGAVYQSGAMGRVFANDVRTGRLLWSFDPQVNFDGGTLATSMGALWNRGLALWQDKVFVATGDCRMVAVDRKTGQKAWDVVSCDKSDNYMQAGAPHVGGGKVFIGNSCIDGGGRRGFVTAFDAESGKIKWRWYTVPGDPAKGYKPENKAMEMADKTWGKKWKPTNGCGAVWDSIAYDAKLNLVYLGVGGANPWNPDDRGEAAGDELFASSIVALKADTGEYVWHYKLDTNDGWNFEAMNTVIADLPVNGKMRRVIMNAPKNGFLYVLDAKTGKFLSAKNFVSVNWASHIDPKTGRPVFLPEGRWWDKPNGAVVSPGPMGAHNVYPMAYSPITRLVYIPAYNMPTLMEKDPTTLVGGSSWDLYYQDDKWKAFGSLVAWDPLTQKERWSVKQELPLNGGVMTTAGNLVFQGEGTGDFKAFQADTGKLLWSYKVGSASLAAPTTVEIDGEQLLLVSVGSGGSGSSLTMVKYVSCKTCRGPTRLLAFKLGGTAKLPPQAEPAPYTQPTLAPFPAELANEGKLEYARQSCETCHGMEVESANGIPPDLLRSGVVPNFPTFDKVVRGGAFRSLGMPVFDYLTDHQLQAIQAYVINQRWMNYNDQETSKAAGKTP